MKILYVLLDLDTDAASAVLALRRAQIAQATDGGAERIGAYLVSASPVPDVIGRLFTAHAIARLPRWDGVPRPWRRNWTAQLARDEAAAAALAPLIRDWEIDLVHSATALTRVGALAARRVRVPHVWTISEWIGEAASVRFPLPDRELAARISDHSAAVIARSAFTAALFRHYRIPNLHVLPDGIDPADFPAPPRRSTDAAIRVGLLETEHAPADLRRFDRILRGVEAANPAIRGAIYPPGDLPSIMAALDLLVVLNPALAFSRGTIAALAARVPVIAVQSGAAAELVADGVTGRLVPVDDDAAFGRAVLALAADPAARAAYGEAGRARALERYHSADHAAAIARLYRELDKK